MVGKEHNQNQPKGFLNLLSRRHHGSPKSGISPLSQSCCWHQGQGNVGIPPLSSSPSQTRARPKELGFAPFVLLTSPCLVALSRRRNCPLCAFPLSTFSLLLQGTLRRFPNPCKVSPALEGTQKSEIVPHILHLSGEDFGNLFAAVLSLNCAASHSFREKCLTTTEQT